MEPISLILGLGTALSGGMSAIGGYQQQQRQTDETNRARLKAREDQIAMQRYTFNKELGVYQQQLADYDAGLLESELALDRSYTKLDKAAAERIAAARFASQESMIQSIQREGQFAALQPGGSSERALTLARGAAGRQRALVADNLLRARFSDIDKFRSMRDQANSYRRQLFSRVPLAPTMAPTPSMPVMQSGPSALSLIGGLGSAAMSGISAGITAENAFGGIGGGGGESTASPDPFRKMLDSMKQYST